MPGLDVGARRATRHGGQHWPRRGSAWLLRRAALRQLGRENAPDATSFRSRSKRDIFGDGVNVAARIQAPPGGICISRAVRDQLRDKSLFAFADRGEQPLKNIARPVRVFDVQFEGAPKTAAPDDAEPWAEVADAAGDPAEAGADEDAAIELVFWDSIKESDRAADFAAYLERYPKGNFVSLARTRLISLTAAEAAEGSDEVKLEITYWESVKDSDDPAMFRAYLDKYPEGHFKELAEARLAQLAENGEDST